MSLSSSLQIGEVIQNAVAFNTKNWQGGRDDLMDAKSLVESVQEFFDLLGQRRIRYVLAGGIALLYYVEGRNAQDLDLLMALSSLEKLPELEISDQDVYSARGKFGELLVDVFLTRTPLFRRVSTKYTQTAHLLERNVPIATVEGLLLLKLYALPSLYRQGNFARASVYETDIAALMYAYRPDMDGLLKELAGYVAASDLAELQNIVAEIHSRTGRFRRQERD